MTCFDFEKRLQSQLDLRERLLSDELAAHAAACGTCRKMSELFQRVETVVVAWPDVEPPAYLADAVIAAWKSSTIPGVTPLPHVTIAATVESETDAPPRSRKSSSAASAALVAAVIALCVMFSVGWQVSRNVQFAQQRAANGTVVVAKSPTASQESADPNDRQLDVLLHDAREAYSALASEALQHVSTASFLLPPAESSPFRSDDATNGLPDSLSRPLSPWGHELRNAFDSLLDRIFTSQDSST